MPSTAIAPTSILQANTDVLASQVNGETLMMDIEQDRYFSLDAIGSDVWARLAQPVAVEALCEGLARDYTVGAERLREDVHALLERMLERGLIRIVG